MGASAKAIGTWSAPGYARGTSLIGPFADSRQLWQGATRSLCPLPVPQFDLPVRRQKAPCSHAGIVAEPVSKSPCGQRMAAAFRREIARKPGRGVSRQFRG